MKVIEILKIIETDGWFKVRQKGSHIHFQHAVKKGTVTIAYHKASQDLAPGTVKSILKQAQINSED